MKIAFRNGGKMKTVLIIFAVIFIIDSLPKKFASDIGFKTGYFIRTKILRLQPFERNKNGGKMKLKVGYKINHHSSMEFEEDFTEEQADRFQKWFNDWAYEILQNVIIQVKENR